MKLACVGPVPPLKTGVSHFNEQFTPFLAERCDIEMFADLSALPSSQIPEHLEVADIDEFLSRPERFDAVLYHMGNHYRFHRRIYEALVKVPGFVLLHDCILSHFFMKYYLERGNSQTLRKLLKSIYPSESDTNLTKFCQGKGDPYRFPMAGIIAKHSLGSIVMSEYGRSILQREAPQARVLKVHFPFFKKSGYCDAESFRKGHGIPPGHFIVTSIGHITPAKRLDVALAAFEEFHRQFPKSLFLIAGDLSPRTPISRLVRKPAFGVRYLGYLKRHELEALMELSDFCINLRYPSHGEMSSALIEMLGRGKVVAVSNYGQFAEFPDDTCVKMNVNAQEQQKLTQALLLFAQDEHKRNAIADSARNYIAAHHTPEAAASAVVEFITANLGGNPLAADNASHTFLEADPFPARQKQALVYNLRRMLLYARRHGVRRLCEEGLSRVFCAQG